MQDNMQAYFRGVYMDDRLLDVLKAKRRKEAATEEE
jgi:hypothetical protein